MIFDWKEYKTNKLLELKEYIGKNNITPTLAIVEVGINDASKIYIRNKIKACDSIGIEVFHVKLEEDVKESILEKTILDLNKNNKIDGIIVQLPLPKKIDENKIINLIDYKKDVDGLTDINLSKIINKKDAFISCTPKGILTMFKELNVSLEGKRVCLIGRSKLVGLPLMHLLMNENATVTVCHSHTIDLSKHTKESDIIITAVGVKKNLIKESMVNENAIVIDVSIIKDTKTGKIYGDADYDALVSKVKYITPVPGGVGQLTVLSLMENVIKAYNIRNN